MRARWRRQIVRWVNLWPPASIGRGFLLRGGEPSEENEPSGCVFPVTSLNEIGGEVFLGNIVLFTCILLGIFAVHVLVASGIEACWMSKVQRRQQYSTLHPPGPALNMWYLVGKEVECHTLPRVLRLLCSRPKRSCFNVEIPRSRPRSRPNPPGVWDDATKPVSPFSSLTTDKVSAMKRSHTTTLDE